MLGSMLRNIIVVSPPIPIEFILSNRSSKVKSISGIHTRIIDFSERKN